MDPSLHVDIRGTLVRGDNLRVNPHHPLTLGIVPETLQAATCEFLPSLSSIHGSTNSQPVSS